MSALDPVAKPWLHAVETSLPLWRKKSKSPRCRIKRDKDGGHPQRFNEISASGGHYGRRLAFAWVGEGFRGAACCWSQRLAFCSIAATCARVSLARTNGARVLLASSPFRRATTIQ